MLVDAFLEKLLTVQEQKQIYDLSYIVNYYWVMLRCQNRKVTEN
jgi:hypothetical protein